MKSGGLFGPRIFITGLLLFVLVTGCSTGDHATSAKVSRLEGTWNCAAATVDGKPLPDRTVKSLRLSLTSNHYRTEKGPEVLFDSTYTTDPSQRPNQINIVGTEGDLTGKEAHGIYLLQGDTLQICYTTRGKPRPAAFTSAQGSAAYLMTWTRQKP